MLVLMLHLRTLGGLSVEGPSGPLGGAASQRKALALLALLAPGGPKGTSRDKLAACLWPESPGEKVTHRLTQLLYSLRRDLGVDDLFLGSAELRLNPDVIRTDLQQFTSALESGDFAAAARSYAGPFLEGFFLKDAPEFERWLDAERDRLAERYRAALETLAEEASRRGDRAAAAGWWRQLSRADPLHLPAAVNYLETLDAIGDRTGARRFAQAYEARLRAEFDLPPDPAFLAAAARLAQPSPTPAPMLPPAPAIAVLPFANLTPDQENEYFSDGMTEELTNALTRVPGLRVASRLSAQRYKGQEGDPRLMAEQLGVSALVSGTVRKVGNRIRITAQLVSGADGCHLWAETYERPLDDVFVLQEEVSRAIVAALPLGPDAGPALRREAPTAAVDAYTLYLRGRYAAVKRTPQALALGVEYFEQAIERDPRYALAHAGLAECWALQGFPEFGTAVPLEAMPRAKAAALEALRLDPRLSEAHTWLGVVHLLFDWDWAASEAEFRRALQLRPENAYAQTWYALFLGAMGRHEESIRRVLYAVALEPAAPQIRLSIGRCYFLAGQHPAALETVEAVWRAEPGSPITALWLGRTLSALGRYPEARAYLEQVPPGQRSPYFSAALAAALAGLGQREESLAICRSLRGVQDGVVGSLDLATAFRLLGDLETEMEVLEEMYQSRCGALAFIMSYMTNFGLRGHSRFEALVGRMGFPAVTHPPAGLR
jgi:TolB-like protein/DNA-binding SARP family transcriptional activator/Tfp pilus assembly protein PilF